jgi:hypothetical protein
MTYYLKGHLYDTLYSCKDDSICGWLILDTVFYINKNKYEEFMKIFCEKLQKKFHIDYLYQIITKSGFHNMNSKRNRHIDIVIYSNNILMDLNIPLKYLAESKEEVYDKIVKLHKICVCLDPLVQSSIIPLLSFQNLKSL